LPLAGYYFLYFSAVGITLPFLPAYLKSLTLTGTQVGLLLSLGPLMSLIAPPLWGHLADRLGRPDRVLNVVTLGALLCLLPLLWAERFGLLAACLASYAAFNSAITPLMDSLALQRVQLDGGSYAHLRLFGSLGFIVSSMAFGFAVSAPSRAAVLVPLAVVSVLLVWSFSLRARSSLSRSPNPLAGLKLLGQREIAVFLAGTSLHWLSCAPFHGLYAIHVATLGLKPRVVGVSISCGVLAELVVMALYPRFATRFSPPQLLLFAFLTSVLRWAGMAVATHPLALVALSLLHGMTFGAFYLAAMSYLAQRVPPEIRASGQALFAAWTFGLGGLFGFLGAGAGYDAFGGHRMFALAALVELLAAACAWSLTRMDARRGATPAAW